LLKGKFSLLSAAVILALASTEADAAQGNTRPKLSGPVNQARAHFARPKGSTVLYDQSGTLAANVIAQNFGDFPTYSSQLADDFVVTDPTGWAVTSVVMQENTGSALAPADATFEVDIYADNGGMPAASPTCVRTGLVPSWDAEFTVATIPLDTECDLAQGTYWLAAVVQQDNSSGGEIFTGLGDTGSQFGTSPVWQNPGGAFGGACTSWTPIATCADLAADGLTATDAMLFQVIGHVDSSSGDGISLTVGVEEFDGDSNHCATSTHLSATAGDKINFCYTVTNHSATTQNYQSLSDDVDGSIFSGQNIPIAPGASYQYNRVKTVLASEAPTSRWTAQESLPSFTPAAGTQAFIDISTSGTALNLGDDDIAEARMPFSFNLYGATTNRLCVDNNGFITIPTRFCAPAAADNESLPWSEFDTAVMPFWDDLYTGGNVYVGTVGALPNRQYVVEWFDKNHVNGGGVSDPGGVTFEAIFNQADNSFDFVYQTVEFGAQGGVNDNGLSATVGMQGGGAGPSTTFSFNTASLSDGQDIHWSTITAADYAASQQVTLDVGAPVLALGATSLSATADVGGTAMATLEIGNTGTRDLAWDLAEAPAPGANPAKIPFVANFVQPRHAKGKTSMGPPPAAVFGKGRNAIPATQGPLSPADSGFTTFANYFDDVNFIDNYVSFTVPDDLHQIAAFSTGIFTAGFVAGTFANNDFSTEYEVAAPSGELWAVSTTDGTARDIGNTGLGYQVTGIRWDATTNSTFLMASDCTNSILYSLDLTSGAVQMIGASSGNCIIDIAIDPSGQMYGVDITADVLVAIDKTSGAAQPIGSGIGFDSNYTQGMDIDPSTNTLYFAGFGGDIKGTRWYTIDTVSGEATVAGEFSSIPNTTVDAVAIAVASNPCQGPSDIPWLSESATSGTTAVGGSDSVTVTFDATGLAAGVYKANVCVNTNDLDNAQVPVPVTFTVGGNDTIFKDGFDGA
jgi:hypothetical protein